MLSHRASMQLWCRDNRQRVQLVCRCCPLSTLALRLARADYKRESDRARERNVIARIMRRCFSVNARLLASRDVNF